MAILPGPIHFPSFRSMNVCIICSVCTVCVCVGWTHFPALFSQEGSCSRQGRWEMMFPSYRCPNGWLQRWRALTYLLLIASFCILLGLFPWMFFICVYLINMGLEPGHGGKLSHHLRRASEAAPHHCCPSSSSHSPTTAACPKFHSDTDKGRGAYDHWGPLNFALSPSSLLHPIGWG